MRGMLFFLSTTDITQNINVSMLENTIVTNLQTFRAVHIHGTNGARFKTANNQTHTRPFTSKKNFFQHPTYEEWYNPKYSNTRHRTIQTISDGTIPSNHHNHHHHHHNHHEHNKSKEKGFYAVNLGTGNFTLSCIIRFVMNYTSLR